MSSDEEEDCGGPPQSGNMGGTGKFDTSQFSAGKTRGPPTALSDEEDSDVGGPPMARESTIAVDNVVDAAATHSDGATSDAGTPASASALEGMMDYNRAASFRLYATNSMMMGQPSMSMYGFDAFDRNDPMDNSTTGSQILSGAATPRAPVMVIRGAIAQLKHFMQQHGENIGTRHAEPPAMDQDDVDEENALVASVDDQSAANAELLSLDSTVREMRSRGNSIADFGILSSPSSNNVLALSGGGGVGVASANSVLSSGSGFEPQFPAPAVQPANTNASAATRVGDPASSTASVLSATQPPLLGAAASSSSTSHPIADAAWTQSNPGTGRTGGYQNQQQHDLQNNSGSAPNSSRGSSNAPGNSPGAPGAPGGGLSPKQPAAGRITPPRPRGGMMVASSSDNFFTTTAAAGSNNNSPSAVSASRNPHHHHFSGIDTTFSREESVAGGNESSTTAPISEPTAAAAGHRRPSNSTSSSSSRPSLSKDHLKMQLSINNMESSNNSNKAATPAGNDGDDHSSSGSALKKGPQIGSGGFASVYLGLLSVKQPPANSSTDSTTTTTTAAGQTYARLVAIKEISFDTDVSREELVRVGQEFELLRTLRHPNIIRYAFFDYSITTQVCRIVMEYVSAGSLQNVIYAGHRVSENVCREFTRQLLEGIAFIHSHGISHRDIKPANVLLHHDGTVKLADFGCSRCVNQLVESSKHVFGSPIYMAPEQIEGDIMAASDIWSLGCTMLELATAKQPWAETGLKHNLYLMFHITGNDVIPYIPPAATSPLQRSSIMSEDFRDFLTQCFVREASMRPTAKELLQHRWITATSQAAASVFGSFRRVSVASLSAMAAASSVASAGEVLEVTELCARQVSAMSAGVMSVVSRTSPLPSVAISRSASLLPNANTTNTNPNPNQQHGGGGGGGGTDQQQQAASRRDSLAPPKSNVGGGGGGGHIERSGSVSSVSSALMSTTSFPSNTNNSVTGGAVVVTASNAPDPQQQQPSSSSRFSGDYGDLTSSGDHVLPPALIGGGSGVPPAVATMAAAAAGGGSGAGGMGARRESRRLSRGQSASGLVGMMPFSSSGFLGGGGGGGTGATGVVAGSEGQQQLVIEIEQIELQQSTSGDYSEAAGAGGAGGTGSIGGSLRERSGGLSSDGDLGESIGAVSGTSGGGGGGGGVTLAATCTIADYQPGGVPQLLSNAASFRCRNKSVSAMFGEMFPSPERQNDDDRSHSHSSSSAATPLHTSTGNASAAVAAAMMGGSGSGNGPAFEHTQLPPSSLQLSPGGGGGGGHHSSNNVPGMMMMMDNVHQSPSSEPLISQYTDYGGSFPPSPNSMKGAGTSSSHQQQLLLQQQQLSRRQSRAHSPTTKSFMLQNNQTTTRLKGTVKVAVPVGPNEAPVTLELDADDLVETVVQTAPPNNNNPQRSSSFQYIQNDAFGGGMGRRDRSASGIDAKMVESPPGSTTSFPIPSPTSHPTLVAPDMTLDRTGSMAAGKNVAAALSRKKSYVVSLTDNVRSQLQQAMIERRRTSMQAGSTMSAAAMASASSQQQTTGNSPLGQAQQQQQQRMRAQQQQQQQHNQQHRNSQPAMRSSRTDSVSGAIASSEPSCGDFDDDNADDDDAARKAMADIFGSHVKSGSASTVPSPLPRALKTVEGNTPIIDAAPFAYIPMTTSPMSSVSPMSGVVTPAGGGFASSRHFSGSGAVGGARDDDRAARAGRGFTALSSSEDEPLSTSSDHHQQPSSSNSGGGGGGGGGSSSTLPPGLSNLLRRTHQAQTSQAAPPELELEPPTPNAQAKA